MKAGSTMTSRDSHEVRHIIAARHARSGRPRCRNEAPRPPISITNATRERAGEERGGDRHAAERRERERDDQALRRAGERREDDDRERRVHATPVPAAAAPRRPPSLACDDRSRSDGIGAVAPTAGVGRRGR